MSGGGKKGSEGVILGYQYFLGMHMVFGHGPFDRIREIKVGDQIVWPLGGNDDAPAPASNAQDLLRSVVKYGFPDGRPVEAVIEPPPFEVLYGGALTQSGRIYINAPEAFGGKGKEGGVQGFVDACFGEATAQPNDYLQGVLGSLVPAFRGVVSLILRQTYVASGNPYIKPWSMYATRIHHDYNGDLQWYDEKAAILAADAPLTSIESTFGHCLVSAGTVCSTGGTFVADFEGTVTEVALEAIALKNAYQIATDGPDAEQFYMLRTSRSVNTISVIGNNMDDDYADGYVVLTVQATLVCPLDYDVSGAGSTSETLCEYITEAVEEHTDTVAGFLRAAAGTGVTPNGVMPLTEGDVNEIGAVAVAARNAVEAPGGSSPTGITSFFDYAYLTKVDGSVYPIGPFIHLAYVQAVGTGTYEDYTWPPGTGIANVGVEAVCPFGYTASWDGSGVVCSITIPETKRIVTTGLGNPSCGLGGSPTTISVDEIVCTRLGPDPDMNPAHMIRECIISPSWGKGYPESSIDEDSFTYAADVLYDELFGLSLVWMDSGNIDDFINVILEHINGNLYTDRVTSKWTLTLVRDDYTVEDLPAFGPSEIKSVEEFGRPAVSDLRNRVVLTFWNRATRKDTPVTLDNLALQRSNAGVVNAIDLQRTGITSPMLATRVAQRELKAVSTPLAYATIILNRTGIELYPGSPFLLNWPELGISEMIMRVGSIDYGSLTDGNIRITCVEDAFAMPSTLLVAPPISQWEDSRQPPQASTQRYVGELPYWTLIKNLIGENPADYAALDPTSNALAVSGVRESSDTLAASVWTSQGVGAYSNVGSAAMCATMIIPEAASEMDTVLTYDDLWDGDRIISGKYAAWDDEMVKVYDFNANAGTITVVRGVLDTIPAPHAEDSRLLFIEGFQFVGRTAYDDTETVNVKLLPKTGLGELDLADATADSYTFAHRHIRPYPPANVKVNGDYWPVVIAADSDMNLTWAHRNRITQTASLIGWIEASITPEAGTTYDLTINGEAGTLLVNEPAITDAFYEWTFAEEKAISGLLDGVDDRVNCRLTMTLTTKRDGYASWQSYNVTVDRADYGYSYGRYYGGYA